MRMYEEPIVTLLKLENEDILTTSDPWMEDQVWADVDINPSSVLFD